MKLGRKKIENNALSCGSNVLYILTRLGVADERDRRTDGQKRC